MDEVENPEESTENRSTKEIKIHEFDDLLKITGGFGRYQMVLYAFMCLVSIPTGAQLLIQVFYGASPPFVCVSTSRNETCASGCCSSCHEYKFRGPFTSAVSQVRNCNVYACFVYRRLPRSNFTWFSSMTLSICGIYEEVFLNLRRSVFNDSLVNKPFRGIINLWRGSVSENSSTLYGLVT